MEPNVKKIGDGVRNLKHLEDVIVVTLSNETATIPDLLSRLSACHSAWSDALSHNVDLALDEVSHARLWEVHSKVNKGFRGWLKSVSSRSAKNKVVEQRKLFTSYVEFIKECQRFYRNYILLLDDACGGISELKDVVATWKRHHHPAGPALNIPLELQPHALRTAHLSLIHLGDLSRYRASSTPAKERKWEPAVGYYTRASSLMPSEAHAHNGLAAIAYEEQDHFRAVYHLFRTLTVEHSVGTGNLEKELRRIELAHGRGELMAGGKGDGKEGKEIKALLAWFLRLQAGYYSAEEFPQREALEREVLSQLKIQVKKRPVESTLFKVVVINLAAEHVATERLRALGASATDNHRQSVLHLIRFNICTFTLLLELLRDELDRVKGEDVKSGAPSGTSRRSLADRLSSLSRRVLALLHLYSAWFSMKWSILPQLPDPFLVAKSRELWAVYAATLTAIAKQFPAPELPAAEYLLQEEADLVGFVPFAESSSRIWEKDGVKKPRKSDSDKGLGADGEMLARLREILVSGLELMVSEGSPLELDNDGQFLYKSADGLDNMLPAPIHEPEPPKTSKADVTNPSRRDTSKRVAPSESGSVVTVTKDAYMTRMVHNLVDDEDPVNPPPTNVPPLTKPLPSAHQSFENSPFQSTAQFGALPANAPFRVSDLVDSITSRNRAPSGTQAYSLSFSPGLGTTPHNGSPVVPSARQLGASPFQRPSSSFSFSNERAAEIWGTPAGIGSPIHSRVPAPTATGRSSLSLHDSFDQLDLSPSLRDLPISNYRSPPRGRAQPHYAPAHSRNDSRDSTGSALLLQENTWNYAVTPAPMLGTTGSPRGWGGNGGWGGQMGGNENGHVGENGHPSGSGWGGQPRLSPNTGAYGQGLGVNGSGALDGQMSRSWSGHGAVGSGMGHGG
ncbi:hypothetical protein P152DRAFT_418769 [Eremomyces bilateralis CBS 781.70]|uniref:Nonsense-mediated mRNA decay factor n=1 Tax=Eremomyces bilateralis CBS 781.70 TaxID=1392243 RepID=A0A6G1G008_9PEZI|nr:uncharacterized protein P152DRAFT_418769 [Eremomyces bilateralis CBS 781.70]KAF1811445.1 hypothetical protein P152DRAFT_418769 [Eremomyces bilateralis CBS 781.70]